MRLSMWIINDWLEKYQPSAIISEGSMTIESIRLFSYGTDLDGYNQSALFIGRNKDFFEQTDSEEVLLIHRMDVISIYGYELEDIFNEISNAFLFYNRWELNLLLGAQKDDPEQGIIDVCQDVFGPMFLLDTQLDVIAMSKNYPKNSVNAIWDELLEQGFASLEHIKAMNDTWFFHNIENHFHSKIHTVPEAKNYTHSIIISYLDDDNRLIGQLLIVSQKNFTQKEIQLSQVVDEALFSIQKKRTRLLNDQYEQNFLSDLISNPENRERYEDFILLFNNWKKTDKFCIIKFCSKPGQKGLAIKSLIRSIKKYFSECVVTVINDAITCCLNVSKSTNTISKIEEIGDHLNLMCGISYSFQGLSLIHVQNRQASDALDYGAKLNNPVTYFSECAFSVFIDNIEDKTYRNACIHPSIILLLEYDIAHHTSYYLTLQTYLQCERSYLESAKLLNIHRNTVIYRLDKIKELLAFGLDLNSYKEREYILFSYRILEKNKLEFDK